MTLENRSKSVDLKDTLFGTIDFSNLDDPEYKEDAVREDIVTPLLRSCGYSPSGPHKLVRSRRLKHPYVLFGSQRKKLSYIPDYILEANNTPHFVLDAKSPDQDVTKGENVAQVYSYAIHPDIRAWNYGLCNGRQLALYEVTSIHPKQVYDLTRINDTIILDINQKLNPRNVKNKDLMDYNLDGGTYLHIVMDVPLTTDLIFMDVKIPDIGMVSEDKYTINVVCNDMAEVSLMLSFDFDKAMLMSLLSKMPATIVEAIKLSFRSQPFIFQNHKIPPSLNIRSRLSNTPQFSRTGEMFIPLNVVEFL